MSDMERHRAAPKAEHAGPPRNPVEVKLEQTQARLTKAQRELANLTRERDQIALTLWLERRMSQAELAERLDRADRRAGGDGVSYAATQKLCWRARERTAVSA